MTRGPKLDIVVPSAFPKSAQFHDEEEDQEEERGEEEEEEARRMRIRSDTFNVDSDEQLVGVLISSASVTISH